MRKELKISNLSCIAHDGEFMRWMKENHSEVILIICDESGYFEDGIMKENVLWEMFCRGDE